MMCEPSNADLVLCIHHGVTAGQQADEILSDRLQAWAQREIMAAWPHIEADATWAPCIDTWNVEPGSPSAWRIRNH